MPFDPITAALQVGSQLIDRLWPDPAQAQQAKMQLFQLQQSGELAKLTADTDLAKAQLAVDQAEAASSDRLQHWRGGAGWICVAAMAYQFLFVPIGSWVVALSGHLISPPPLDDATLGWLTGGMLGLGGYHTYQQVQQKKP